MLKSQKYISRRFALAGAVSSAGQLVFGIIRPHARRFKTKTMLDNSSIELHGGWDPMNPTAVLHVLDNARNACLDGINLPSDGQPEHLRVELRPSGPPAIWLHPQPKNVAWIFVNIGTQDWSKLAYQFGHELGHVVANSWREDAKPASPCQWLEEALVEAFSLRGLGRLADTWSRNPPFAHDSGFGASLAVYRQNIVESHGKLGTKQGIQNGFSAWFKSLQSNIEREPYLNNYAKAASLVILDEYENDPSCLESLGALNRWPKRSSAPILEYIDNWEASCNKINISTSLPARLRELLNVS